MARRSTFVCGGVRVVADPTVPPTEIRLVDNFKRILARIVNIGGVANGRQEASKSSDAGSTPATPAISHEADFRKLRISQTPYPKGDF